MHLTTYANQATAANQNATSWSVSRKRDHCHLTPSLGTRRRKLIPFEIQTTDRSSSPAAPSVWDATHTTQLIVQPSEHGITSMMFSLSTSRKHYGPKMVDNYALLGSMKKAATVPAQPQVPLLRLQFP
jgi:hypothetical protein